MDPEESGALVPRRKVVEPRVEVPDRDGRWAAFGRAAFGRAVLGFHHRVFNTAMCRCGRTVIECDVLAQARAHELVPQLPEGGR